MGRRVLRGERESQKTKQKEVNTFRNLFRYYCLAVLLSRVLSSTMFFRLFIAAALLLVAQALSPLAAYGHEESALIETVDVTSDGGIKRLIIAAGTGATAVKGSKIAAHYDGKLEDGTQFDSSRKRGTPFTFALGGGQVIKGVRYISSALLAPALACTACSLTPPFPLDFAVGPGLCWHEGWREVHPVSGALC